MAYSEGCKGSTVYRDGCKPFQPLNALKNSEPGTKEVAPGVQPEPEVAILTHQLPLKAKRPRSVPGTTFKIETAEGDFYITINYDERGMPFEMFADLGKSGTTTAAAVKALCITISLGLRYGIPPFEYISKLRGIKSIQHGMGPNAVYSIPDAIGQILEEYMVQAFGEDWASDHGWISQVKETAPLTPFALKPAAAPEKATAEACSNCGAQLYHVEGCRGGTCYSCGQSKCS